MVSITCLKAVKVWYCVLKSIECTHPIFRAQPATAYAPQPAQTAYVHQAPQAAYATQAPARQQTYETYQAAPAAPAQYTYTTRAQVQAQVTYSFLDNENSSFI